METQIQKFKSRDYHPKKGETSKASVEKKVLFKPMESEKLGLKLAKEDHLEMIEELTKRLTELGLDSKKKSVAPLTKDLDMVEELTKRLNNLNLAPLIKKEEFETSKSESSNEEDNTEINKIESILKESE